jgi:EVE domain
VTERSPKSWILTGSLENFRVNVERGFDLIGFKEGRRRQAEQFEPGDEVFFYVTGVQAFGALARVRSEMFEDREPIWPGIKRRSQKAPPDQKREPYPWRVEAEALIVLAEPDFVPAEELAERLEHVRKWPHEHWHLAFQGQLRTIGDADSELLRDRLAAAQRAGAPARA